MAIQTANKATVPAGSDAWNLTADIKKALETARIIVPVASQAERDGLAPLFPGGVLPVPTMVWRTDTQHYQNWNGTGWRNFPDTYVGEGNNQPVVKSAQAVITTGAFGDFTLTLPVAFPNGITAAVVQEASTIANNDYPVLIKVRMDIMDKTKIVGRCYRADDSKFASGSINVTYMAWGY